MDVVIFAFDHITFLDAAGPYEVLAKVPGARIRWVGPEGGQVTADGGLRIALDATLDEVRRADVLLVPGGAGTRSFMEDARVLTWLREVHATTRFTASVCTGSLLLAAAGLLRGLEATTHWTRLEVLRDYGAQPVEKRVVSHGKFVIGAGVSAGIDMALTLVAQLGGKELAQAIQLGLEYDPQPPFDSGNAARAPASLKQNVQVSLDALGDALTSAS